MDGNWRLLRHRHRSPSQEAPAYEVFSQDYRLELAWPPVGHG